MTNNSTKILKFVGSNLGYLVLVSLILYIYAILVCFVFSRIFKPIDDSIEEIENEGTRKFSWILIAFVQLVMSAIAYFFIDQFFLHNIYIPKKHSILKHNPKEGVFNINLKSISSKMSETLGTLPTTEYAFHIILIVMLIEMNSSLTKELHKVSNILSTDEH